MKGINLRGRCKFIYTWRRRYISTTDGWFSITAHIVIIIDFIVVVLAARSVRCRAEERTSRQVVVGPARRARPQTEYDRVLGRLLSLERNLGRHHPLSFGDQVALGAAAVSEATVAFMPLQPGDHAVVSASGAFGFPRSFLRERTSEEGQGADIDAIQVLVHHLLRISIHVKAVNLEAIRDKSIYL